jgi:benzoate membrane transport protein
MILPSIIFTGNNMTPSVVPPIPPASGRFSDLVRSLRDLPGSLTISSFTAAFIVILITYTGPLLIVLQAAKAANLSPEQTSSWVWSVMVGNGVATILMSLLFRQPITSPYPTAGAALLVTSIAQFSFSEAVGAFILSWVAVVLLGMSGLFGRVMRLVPQPVVLAVLAGVLLRFGLGIFNALDDHPLNPLMIGAMIAAFFWLKRVKFRAPSLGAMLIGVLIAAASGQMNFTGVSLVPTVPVFTMPVFTLNAALSLALPLFVLAISAQYAPGQAVLLANGYDAPLNRILTISGLVSMVFALFGGHGNSLGALTAAIVVGPDAQPDHSKRYATAVVSGSLHIAFGLFGSAVVDLFGAFPSVFVSTIAGLSLSAVIGSSLGGAMEKPDMRDAALIAFLCTAGDFTLFGIGAPFWGLVIGVAVHVLMTFRPSANRTVA